MPVYITSVRIHAQNLAKAKDSAIELSRGIRDALARANAFTDPNLSDIGLRAKRTELATEFREAAAVDLTKLRAGLENSRSYLAQTARENIRVPDTTDALVKAEIKWRQVERVLTAGGELRDLIATADFDTALAIAEFGPSWAQANDYRPAGLTDRISTAMYGGRTPDPTAWLTRAVYTRVAEVAPDPALAELAREAMAADTRYATAEPYLDAGQSFVDHGSADMLGAAIASRAAESAVTSADAA
jgi:hypothetical protein